MKKKRYTEEQIIGAIKSHQAGEKVADICRRLGIAEGTFYNWRSKFGGLEVRCGATQRFNLAKKETKIPN